ncbi:PREDICTED: uncharacterized protein LOC104613166 [Nelumbo nucifera]|uniref:Uncharacterized protein n=2 Tax=Nelumbo nucifera TaxID=4432 RepID=A0A822XL80_NELNU|nr:PREDICTED: uncharacterized protein LOC104613166 [Nelumbo nucifera]DAD21130.1 TPA_asm: hypothetical protein HUJ06_022593 [Nelumbo nucifera]
MAVLSPPLLLAPPPVQLQGLSHQNSSKLFFFGWGLRRNGDVKLITHRSRCQAFRILANSNASRGKGNSSNEIIMVDPLEAKRLAAKQMQEIKAKEKFKRRRQIEALNGAWAMIGLTAGLVIEGQTGNSILTQLAGYWHSIIGFFFR